MPISNSQINFYDKNNVIDLTNGLKAKIFLLDQLLNEQKWSAKIWQESWDDFNHFVLQTLTVENELAAFALWTMPPLDEVAHLLKIVVGLPWRTQGLAIDLFDNFSAKFPTKGIYLEVKTTNTMAVKFYEKMGLKIVTKTKNYYGQGEDAYKMLKAALLSASMPDIP